MTNPTLFSLPWLVAALLVAPRTNAQAWQWARDLGGTDADIGKDVCLDPQNNVHVAGWTLGEVTGECTTLTGSGGTSIFLAKYDPFGACLWSRVDGGPGDDVARGIATDAQGNTFITGSYSTLAQFGTVTLGAQGDADVFVAKYGPDGDFLWVAHGGGPFDEQGTAVATDAEGNVFVCGRYRSTCTFGAFTIGTVNSNFDAFLAKLDADGNWLWIRRAGDIGGEEANAVAVDAQGDAYITGWFSSPIAVFSSQQVSPVGGGADIFLAKYTGDGTCLWVRGAGAASSDQGNALAIDSQGRPYISGWLSGDTAHFGGITLLPEYGEAEDLFVAKYDPQGECLWAVRAGGTGMDVATGLSFIHRDVLIVSGQFTDTAAIGGTTLEAMAGTDVYTAGYDTTGAPLWGLQAGGSGYEQAGKVVGTATGVAYTTGSYDTQASFSGWTLDAVAASDLYLAKVGEMATALPPPTTNAPALAWDPAARLLSIATADGSTFPSGQLQVFDAAGRLARSIPLSGQRHVALGAMGPGLYLVRLNMAKGQAYLRVLLEQ